MEWQQEVLLLRWRGNYLTFVPLLPVCTPRVATFFVALNLPPWISILSMSRKWLLGVDSQLSKLICVVWIFLALLGRGLVVWCGLCHLWRCISRALYILYYKWNTCRSPAWFRKRVFPCMSTINCWITASLLGWDRTELAKENSRTTSTVFFLFHASDPSWGAAQSPVPRIGCYPKWSTPPSSIGSGSESRSNTTGIEGVGSTSPCRSPQHGKETQFHVLLSRFRPLRDSEYQWQHHPHWETQVVVHHDSDW